MGWDSITIVINVSLDRHGGKEQEEADRLYEELLKELEKVVEQPKYDPIGATI